MRMWRVEVEKCRGEVSKYRVQVAKYCVCVTSDRARSLLHRSCVDQYRAEQSSYSST
jgi:hypothetical protein